MNIFRLIGIALVVALALIIGQTMIQIVDPPQVRASVRTEAANVANAQEGPTATPAPTSYKFKADIEVVRKDADGWEVKYVWDCPEPFSKWVSHGNSDGASGSWPESGKVKIEIKCISPDGVTICAKDDKTLRSPLLPTKTPEPTNTPGPPKATKTPGPSPTHGPTRTPKPGCVWCATQTAMPPTETEVPPTATETQPPPPTETPKATETGTPAPTATFTAPPPTEEPTETPPPTEEPPTQTPPPTEEPPQVQKTEVVIQEGCVLEQDVKTADQVDQTTGESDRIRYWPRTDGSIAAAINLTDDPRLDGDGNPGGKSTDGSTDPSGCLHSFEHSMPGSDETDIWTVATSGPQDGLWQVTNNGCSVDPEWNLATVKLLYTNTCDGFVYETDAYGTVHTRLDLQGFDTATSLDGMLLALWDKVKAFAVDMLQGLTADLGVEGKPEWCPDSSCQFVVSNGMIYLQGTDGQPAEEYSQGDNIAPDPRSEPQFDIIERDGQLLLHYPDKEVEVKGGENTTVWNDEFNHVNPEWWHNPEGRVEPNPSTFARLMSEAQPQSHHVETAQPVCPNYEGTSLVECLALAGMDYSFAARALMAVQYGLVDNVDQYDPHDNGHINTELLELLRGN